MLTPIENVVYTTCVDEVWKPVIGYENIYEVSSLGRVKSLDRVTQMIDGRQRRSTGQLLELRVWSNGYYCVTLYKSESGPKVRTIHSLVAEAFIGPCPYGKEVLHKDGDNLNNVDTNLRYGTQADNQYDSIEYGSHYNANKIKCPEGHILELPNLMKANWSRGARACLSCSRGRATVNNAKKQWGRELDFREEANKHYAKLLTNYGQ